MTPLRNANVRKTHLLKLPCQTMHWAL